eukprot:1977306-Pleurochrysis_carterae.AAC.2
MDVEIRGMQAGQQRKIASADPHAHRESPPRLCRATQAVPQSVHGERTGIDRPWTSYLGFLKVARRIVPGLLLQSPLDAEADRFEPV